KWQPAGAKTDDLQLEVVDLANRAARSRFVEMPHPLYDGDPNYVAPLKIAAMKALDPVKCPTYQHVKMRAVIAHRGGRPVGRMTAQFDTIYNEYHETKAGWIGHFESIDDASVAHALFDDGIQWLKDQGMEEVFGPANPTMNYQSGLLVENFDRPPFIDNLYNPRYYQALFESYGFAKAKDLLCWWVDSTEGMDTKKRQRIVRIAERIKKREGITIRSASIKDADAEIERIHQLFNGAWQKNWGNCPVPKHEFIELAQDLKQVVIEDLLIFVMVDDRVVGFCLTVPNIVEKMPRNGHLFPFGWTKLVFGLKKTKYLRLYLLGTLPEYRKRGLESIMFAETLLRAKRLGYTGGEVGWTLEDNDLVNRAIESMEGHIDRRYRIYGIDLK
ncbi:MAG: N-acetyltransferase, partial [Myxococcota bacterium]